MYGEIYRLYECRCSVCLSEKEKTGSSFALSSDLIEVALKRIYEGFDVKQDIDPELYKHTVDVLNKAVSKGFGKVELGGRNEEFLHELKYNNSVFAAFKTHRQQNDLHQLLLDEKGDLKPFARFKKDTEPVIGSYNTHWLQTEYTTAVKCARTASEFLTYERESDLYPNIKWLSSMAVEPREAHKSYYGMIRALNDPFWKTTYPGCLWGCQCGSANTAEPVTHGEKQPVKDAPKPARGLEENPAYSKACFSDQHPYRTNSYPGAEKAVESFCDKQEIKQQRTSIREWAKENLAEQMVQAPGIDTPVKFTMTGIKEAINQPHKFLKEKNEALKNIRELIRAGKYVRFDPDVKDNKMVKGYHYIRIKIAKETSYAVIRELTNGEKVFYSVVEKIRGK